MCSLFGRGGFLLSFCIVYWFKFFELFCFARINIYMCVYITIKGMLCPIVPCLYGFLDVILFSLLSQLLRDVEAVHICIAQFCKDHCPVNQLVKWKA